MRQVTESIRRFWSHVALWLRWSLVIIGGALGVYMTGLLLVAFVDGVLYFYISHTISTQAVRMGLDSSLAAIGAIVASTIFVAFVYWNRPLRRFWSLPSMIFVPWLAIVIMGLMVTSFRYAVERDGFFDSYTSQPVKYYTRDQQTKQIRVYSQPVSDPFSQERAQPITAEVVREYLFQQEHQPQQDDSVPFERIVNFFDTIRSELTPLVWYDYSPSLGYRFYYHPGRDGKTGQVLWPIGPETVERIYQERAAEAAAKERVQTEAEREVVTTASPVTSGAPQAPSPYSSTGTEHPSAPAQRVSKPNSQPEPAPSRKFSGSFQIYEGRGSATFDCQTGELTLNINDLTKAYAMHKDAGDNCWRIGSLTRGPLFSFRCGEREYEVYKLAASEARVGGISLDIAFVHGSSRVEDTLSYWLDDKD